MIILWGKYYYISLPNRKPQVYSVSRRTQIAWVCAHCPALCLAGSFPKVHPQNMLPKTTPVYSTVIFSSNYPHHPFRDSSPTLPIRKVRHTKAKNSLNFPLSDLWHHALKSGPLCCPETPGYPVEFSPPLWGRNGTLTPLSGSILLKNSMTRRAEWQYRRVPGNYWCFGFQHIFYLPAQWRSFPRPACRTRLWEGFQLQGLSYSPSFLARNPSSLVLCICPNSRRQGAIYTVVERSLSLPQPHSLTQEG